MKTIEIGTVVRMRTGNCLGVVVETGRAVNTGVACADVAWNDPEFPGLVTTRPVSALIAVGN